MTRHVSPAILAEGPRPDDAKATDASALRAIAQAAVNVELFTVPLYMATMYSIRGMHQITGKNSDFYRNRLWPGLDTTASPEGNANKQAFNGIFSVFIEEMLHLQMAANIASAMGVTPVFTSPALQDERRGWKCYGPTLTVIPHIVDLTDTTRYHEVKVNLGAFSKQQLQLFLAIEQPDEDARKVMKVRSERKYDYFPPVPFKGWKPENTEKDLPMFGTIGAMYQCYYDYMNLSYEDGTTLWEYVFQPVSRQNDMFNVENAGHPEREYLQFRTTLIAHKPGPALAQAVNMMDAITDQGEGRILKKKVLLAVQAQYQASDEALKADYPRYTDTGKPAPSGDAAARFHNGARDHYERFTDLANPEVLKQVTTWQSGAHWTAGDLQTKAYDPKINPHKLPSTKDIADAMNRVSGDSGNYELISRASIGAIAGVTTVLDQYWACPGVSFPYPSMVGSGDRMAICWALFGKPPDLSIGIDPVDPNKLYHTCQGLDFKSPGNKCAHVEVFHACRGSNGCKAQGGCGFVQLTTGGKSGCGPLLLASKASAGSPVYSPPSDNKCASFGGCASPISASQLFPPPDANAPTEGGTMQLFDFTGDFDEPVPIAHIEYEVGEKVHHVAYRAYELVMQHRQQQAPPEPELPSDLRLVFPPST